MLRGVKLFIESVMVRRSASYEFGHMFDKQKRESKYDNLASEIRRSGGDGNAVARTCTAGFWLKGGGKGLKMAG